MKRISVDQSHAVKKQLDLAQVIEDTLLLVSHKLSVHRIRIEKQLSSVLFYGLAADFQQIITNLVDNAMAHAYAKETGGLIKILLEEKDGAITLSVTDFGKASHKKTCQKYTTGFLPPAD